MKNIRFYFFVILLVMLQSQAYALTWDDLWWRPDEQGKHLLDKGKAKQAAQKFQDEKWKAAAFYRAGQYQKAAEQYAENNTSQAHYNRGNALAHMGQYQEAISAYDKALSIDKHLDDAKTNREILKKLLKQQKSQSSKNQKQQKQQKKQQSKNDKQKQQKKQQSKNDKQKQQQKQNQQAKQDKQEKKSMSQQKQAQKKAAKQWLRRIPDNPGGLLRQKFLRDYLRMQSQ